VDLSLIYFMPTEWVEIFNSVSRLIEALVSVFGPRVTAILFIVGFVASVIYKRRQERRREKIYELVADEKERTIERLTKENLSLRIVIFKEIAHWTDDELERFVMQNRLQDEIDAQRALTGQSVARRALAEHEQEKDGQPTDQRLSSKRSAP